MLSLEDAVDRILSTVQSLGGESIPVTDAAGRIALERLTAALDMPRFDNSAMDGYAVQASNLVTAGAHQPVSLRLCGRVAAGEVFQGVVSPGTCVRVFTGSPLPEGTDAVAMQEDTCADPTEAGRIQFLDRVRAWENVRLRGEDVKHGDVLAEPGDCLNAGQLGLLAAAGFARIFAGRRPTVGLLATGSELIEAGVPPGPGQIYESNRAMLAALVDQAGAIPRVFPLVPDSPEPTRTAIERAMEQCDVVVASGGVSVGECDFVKGAFEQLGGQLDFWQVAIKPGKPFMFGRVGGKLFFGLPGNPASAFVTFLLLVRPALRRLQGAAKVSLSESRCVLGETLANPVDRRHFIRVVTDPAGGVRSAGTQASHVLGSLAKANGLMDMPAQSNFAQGSTVRVLRVD